MSHDPPDRRLVNVFLVTWIVFQIGLPLVRGLDDRHGDYFYGGFTWSMFGRTRMLADLSFFAFDSEGTRRPLPRRPGMSPRFAGDPAVPMRVGFPKEGQIESRAQAWVDHLAATRSDAAGFGAEIHWLVRRDPAWPERWSYAREVKPE